jgi:hypothetical protein
MLVRIENFLNFADSMRVYVLLFNAGTDNEGIHTVQMGGRNKILMFASEDDATRYALLLEAQDFPPPTIEAMDSRDIEEFCQEAGYDSETVAEGMLAIPPEKNVAEPEWDPDGVLQAAREAQGTEQPQTDDKPETEFSDDELENIRRRLEGLL